MAHLSVRKGHDVLLEAMARLVDRDWVLVLAGADDRDSVFAASVRARAGQPDLAGRVVITGTLSGPALAAEFARASLMVLATRHEGYGMAVVEAVAHGVPVVATAAGAVPEALPARGRGARARRRPAERLHDAVARLLDDHVAALADLRAGAVSGAGAVAKLGPSGR